jgi:hypothetical protein
VATGKTCGRTFPTAQAFRLRPHPRHREDLSDSPQRGPVNRYPFGLLDDSIEPFGAGVGQLVGDGDQDRWPPGLDRVGQPGGLGPGNAGISMSGLIRHRYRLGSTRPVRPAERWSAARRSPIRTATRCACARGTDALNALATSHAQLVGHGQRTRVERGSLILLGHSGPLSGSSWRTPNTYLTAGIRRGTATPCSTRVGTTSESVVTVIVGPS